jgi:hypothetical protein
MEGARPADHLPQMGNKDAARDRFDKEIIRSSIENAGDHSRVVQGGKDQNRDAAKGTDFAANGPSVHIRHHQVKEQHVGALLPGKLYTFDPAVACDYIESVSLEQHAQQLGYGCVVVYDKDLCRHGYLWPHYHLFPDIFTLQVVYRINVIFVSCQDVLIW